MSEDGNNTIKIVAGVIGCGCLATLLIGGTVFGLLGFVGYNSFTKFEANAKSAEAALNLKMISDGASAYYQSEHFDDKGSPLPSQFPTADGTFKSRKKAKLPSDVPKGTKFDPGYEVWEKEPWKALRFNTYGPIHYRYSYKPNNKENAFETFAEGDLDGDGVTSKYMIKGSADADSGELSTTPVFLEDPEKEFE